MTLLHMGLALGFYTGLRVAEHTQVPHRRRRLLRDLSRRQARRLREASHSAAQIKERREDFRTANWALALCVGTYALPVLGPAAQAVTVYTILPLLRASERELLDQKRPGDDLVNAAVCIGSLGLGQPLVAAVQSWIFHLADLSVLKSRKRARRLLDTGLPESAPVRVLHGEVLISTAVDAQRPGDQMLLSPGEAVPVDGEIMAGSVQIDQQRLTGESLPRALGAGEVVHASTLVLRGEARVRVTQAGADTTVARLERLLRDSVGHHTQLQLKAEAVADKVALPLLAATALSWPLIGSSAAVALLFSAPINAVRASGALTVSNQLANLLGQGILIKDGRALEAFAEVAWPPAPGTRWPKWCVS